MNRARVRASHKDFVLDVGSGGHPHSSADVLVDRFVDDTQHRNQRHLVRDRLFVCADITALPFAAKAFDYVICNQVVEHIHDATGAMSELSRIGRQGFVAMPTEFLEFLSPHPEHVWVCALKDGIILLKRKRDLHILPSREAYGTVFWTLHGVPAFKRLMRSHSDLFMVKLEWKGHIKFRVLNDGEEFYDYANVSSYAALLRNTPPGSIGEWVRDGVEIHLPLEQVRKIGSVRNRIRRWLRW